MAEENIRQEFRIKRYRTNKKIFHLKKGSK